MSSSEDPAPAIREECQNHHCPDLKSKLDACTTRVLKAENTEETCVEEFFDLMECVDHCAAPKIFQVLK